MFRFAEGRISEHSYIGPLAKQTNSLGGGAQRTDRKGGVEMRENRIIFDLESIPESERMKLVSIVYEEVKKYFQEPGVQEKYELWLEKREAKKAATKAAE